MSFTQNDLENYLSKFDLPASAMTFIRQASLGMSRAVGQTSFPSVVTEMQSQKMMSSVNLESQTGELAYALHLDFDGGVDAFYEQPPPVDCLRTDKNGRAVLRTYRADFLVLHADGPLVVEVKQHKEIAKRIKKYPTDWIMCNDRPVDLPAKRAFGEMGLPHQIVVNTDLPQVRVSNIRTLLKLRLETRRGESDEMALAAQSLSERSALTIADLATEIGITDLTPILQLVLERKAFIDLDGQLLTQPESCWISDNQAVLEEVLGKRADERTVSRGALISIAIVPKRSAAEATLKKLEKLEKEPSSRSARRWRKEMRERPDCTPFQALIPKYHRSGNRLTKRPGDVLKFAEESLIDFWATKMRPSVASAHRLYVEAAEIRHPTFAPVTKTTFKAMAARIRQIAAQARGGLRAENAAASPTDVEDRAMTPTRPFEVAAVDHCLLKVYCVLLRTEEYVYVCRPWITVLRDLYTGEPLAWWVSFSDPSRRAIAMVIRSCLRRHGRLPETIQVDRGSDFRSVYQSSLCAHFGIHLAIRPTTNSRFGGKIERIFNTFKTMWLDLRPGNCTDIRKLRSLSGSHHPANLPCLTLPSLLAEIGDFFSWFCTQKLEQAATPSLLRKEGLARFPFSGKSLTYDNSFVIATAVDVKSLSVDPSRGIKVGDAHFWAPELKGLPPRRAVEVRLEPEDHTCIYACAGDHWITCRSNRGPQVATLDPIYRLAESIVVMDAQEVRKAAKSDSDMGLVKLVHAADDRFAEQNGARASDVEPEEVESQADLWHQVRDQAIEGAAVSQWRAQP